MTFCTSAAVIAKAGGKVSEALTIQYDNFFIPWAESTINTVCRYDFLTNYPSNASAAVILEEVSANLAAIDAVKWDMEGYTSRIEAEDIINVCRDAALRGLSILRDKKAQDYVNAS